MTKERRLGRGLEALLGRGPDANTGSFGDDPVGAAASPRLPHQPLGVVVVDDGLPSEAKPGQTSPIAISSIDPNPYQPRAEFDADELASLVESLKSNGLLQPVVVRRVDDRYQLIAGERRWRAAQEAGWQTLPAMILDADDQQMAELALVENLHRTDLNAIDKGISFQRYLEKFSATHEELARRVNVDRTTVSNLIRLLELPAVVQAAVRAERISSGHARALLPLETEEQQVQVCERTIAQGLSVRAVEALVQEMLAAADGAPVPATAGSQAMPTTRGRRPPQVVALELELRQALGTKVDLRVNARQRGKIVVHFANQDEFDRLHELLLSQGAAQRQQAG
ncbi:MAG: ParB/RepB/Spo0J family partition protein [Pirellulales bacterium]